MLRSLKLSLCGLLCGCVMVPGSPDLGTFLQRRAACDHVRGEFPDPPDVERAKEIELQVAEYCSGTDAQLAALKRQYSSDAAVSKRLAEFEPRIEKVAK